MADVSLTGDFPAATQADWRKLVDKTLGEAPFASLEKFTVEGLPIEPLYPPAPTPNAPPFRSARTSRLARTGSG
jgi:hypothetical protein